MLTLPAEMEVVCERKLEASGLCAIRGWEARMLFETRGRSGYILYCEQPSLRSRVNYFSCLECILIETKEVNVL